MIITFLLQYWKKILDWLVLVAVILGVFLWNPMGIFSGGGLKFHSTANMVTGIQEIGELITAEYYGEVVASMDEARYNVFTNDEVNNEGDEVFSAIKYSLLELYKIDTLKRSERKIPEGIKKTLANIAIFRNDVKRRNIQKKFAYFNTELRKESSYTDLICFLGSTELGKEVKESKSDFVEKYEEDVLFKLYSELKSKRRLMSDMEFEVYLQNGLTEAQTLKDFNYSLEQKEMSRKDKRKQLVMIGRGWVKAGFKFDRLTEETFFYDKDEKVVHLYGMKPQILNADINPWFIPEKKVQGFQLVTYKGDVGFEDVKKVKMHCVAKLKDNAVQSQILEQAHENGKDALKAFFSLVTGDEIKSIEFHTDALQYQYEQIVEDKMIDYHEAALIDSLYRRQLADLKIYTEDSLRYSQAFIENKQAQLKGFISKLKQFPFVYKAEHKGMFNRYSLFLANMLSDGFLDISEVEALRQCRVALQLSEQNGQKVYLWQQSIDDIYWRTSPLDFIPAYNTCLKYSEGLRPVKFVQEKALKTIFTPDNIDLVSYINEGDSVSYIKVVADSAVSEQISDLYYPYQIQKKSWEEILDHKKLTQADIPIIQDWVRLDSVHHKEAEQELKTFCIYLIQENNTHLSNTGVAKTKNALHNTIRGMKDSMYKWSQQLRGE